MGKRSATHLFTHRPRAIALVPQYCVRSSRDFARPTLPKPQIVPAIQSRKRFLCFFLQKKTLPSPPPQPLQPPPCHLIHPSPTLIKILINLRQHPRLPKALDMLGCHSLGSLERDASDGCDRPTHPQGRCLSTRSRVLGGGMRKSIPPPSSFKSFLLLFSKKEDLPSFPSRCPPRCLPAQIMVKHSQRPTIRWALRLIS